MKNRTPARRGNGITALGVQARLTKKGEPRTMRDISAKAYKEEQNGGARWHGAYDAKGNKVLVPCTGTLRKAVRA